MRTADDDMASALLFFSIAQSIFLPRFMYQREPVLRGTKSKGMHDALVVFGRFRCIAFGVGGVKGNGRWLAALPWLLFGV